MDLDAIRARLANATPAPWLPGQVWLKAGLIFDAAGNRVGPGGTHCAWCKFGAPARTDPAMDINGQTMSGHIHRNPDPFDPEHSISSGDYSVVLWGHDDMGPNLSEEDAEFIRHAPTDVAALLDEVERLTAGLREIYAAMKTGQPIPADDLLIPAIIDEAAVMNGAFRALAEGGA